jgi:hypothetical protein
MNGLTMRRSLFDRALMRIEAEAAGDLGHFSPRALARQYLMVERASCDVQDTEIANELGARSNKLLKSIADAPSRDIHDVAAKLAVAIVEGNNGETGPIAEAHQAILAHCLAELTILAGGPLPATGVLLGMTETELELQDAPMCGEGVEA